MSMVLSLSDSDAENEFPSSVSSLILSPPSTVGHFTMDTPTCFPPGTSVAAFEIGPMLVAAFLVSQAIGTKVTTHGSRLWTAGARIVAHTTVTPLISWMEPSSAPRQPSDSKASPASPQRPSTPLRDTARPSSPASPTKRSHRASTSRSQVNPRHWAFSTVDFNGVVSTSQASMLFNEAVADSREVDMREISSFEEALDWFNRLSLAS
ncbi:hypothetical protein BT96DRAFT_1002664 [Gymnopus androsaceus JB14]|uniref:Uncharacterized protein n=1 Tax=Gymnopus androsaceus JB14 TaxID=1447944 RepID=A0A6A4GW87_9AGAR|nr:hypothetical protein BT96DRAFT_1002664 [Gymnopus androsaceus JB14]